MQPYTIFNINAEEIDKRMQATMFSETIYLY